MSNCKFLRQKKQVQINGEWVDTRSYRYLTYCDGGTPSVTVRGGKPNGEVIVRLVNDNGVVSGEKIISLNADGNGYIELEIGDAIASVCAKWNEPSCVAEISGCYVCYFGTDLFSELNDVGTLIISCSIYRRANASGGIFYFRGTNIIFKGFDTSQVTDMSGMFASCSGLTSLNVNSFDTSKITNMAGMFQYCSSLTSLDLSNFNTSNVSNMGSMFSGCRNLTSLDISGFDMTNVDDTRNMFDDCTSLKTIRMVGCNQTTIDKIKRALSSAVILSKVTIITE